MCGFDIRERVQDNCVALVESESCMLSKGPSHRHLYLCTILETFDVISKTLSFKFKWRDSWNIPVFQYGDEF